MSQLSLLDTKLCVSQPQLGWRQCLWFDLRVYHHVLYLSGSLLVLMTLIVIILRSSWREFLHHNSLALSAKMTNCQLSLRHLFVVNSSTHNSPPKRHESCELLRQQSFDSENVNDLEVTKENEGSGEESFAWASSMLPTEEDSSLPLITRTGRHSSFSSTFASACVFFACFAFS